MRKTLLVAVICLLAAVVFAGAAKVQPLNVKTGLWQMTLTNTINGLPAIPPDMQARLAQMSPEQRARLEAVMKSKFGGTPQTTTYKTCATKEGLEEDTFTGPDQKCNWTILSSTSSELEAKGTSCEAGKNLGMKTNVDDLKVQALDSQRVKASGKYTSVGNGRTVSGNFSLTGKWIGATCPAGVH